MAGRRKRSDSIQGKQQLIKTAHKIPAPPPGVNLDTDERLVLWEQYTSARSIEDWRVFDLLQVAKLVDLELMIRRAQEQVFNESLTTSSARGGEILNPAITALNTLQRQQLAIIRSLALGVQTDDARESNKRGQRVGLDDATETKKSAAVLALSLVNK